MVPARSAARPTCTPAQPAGWLRVTMCPHRRSVLAEPCRSSIIVGLRQTLQTATPPEHQTPAPPHPADGGSRSPATPPPQPPKPTPSPADRPRRGHQHRVIPTQLLGADQRRPIPRNVRLRRQRIHRLRTADPRHCLQRKTGRTQRRDRPDPLTVGQRRQKPDQHTAGTQTLNLLNVRRRHLQHQPSPPRLRRVGCRQRAGLGVGVVGDHCPLPGAGLHHHLTTIAAELAHDLGHEPDTVLARSGFLRDADPHGASLITASVSPSSHDRYRSAMPCGSPAHR